MARNQLIRGKLTKLADDHKLRIFFPPTTYCTDNGVMIAWNGVERVLAGQQDDFDMDVAARIPFPKYEFPLSVRRPDRSYKHAPLPTAAA